jgi:hypothetical protein
MIGTFRYIVNRRIDKGLPQSTAGMPIAGPSVDLRRHVATNWFCRILTVFLSFRERNPLHGLEFFILGHSGSIKLYSVARSS